MQRQELTPNIFTISGVLSSTECEQLVAFAEARGFDAATINAWDGPRLDREARNNDRVIADDLTLAGTSGIGSKRLYPGCSSGGRYGA